MQHRKGIFIGFIGLPGVGKSTLAQSLAEQIKARVFIEPSEEEWDFDHQRDWQEQVYRIESWICQSNFSKFSEARTLAKQGFNVVADAGIFLVNKELIYAPSTQWWYGLLSSQEKSQLYALAEKNWANELCRPDVLVLIETDKATWLSYMKKRGRSDDNHPESIRQYDIQKKLIAESAERYARENGIPFSKFINHFGTPDKNAAELAKLLDIDVRPQPADNKNTEEHALRCKL